MSGRAGRRLLFAVTASSCFLYVGALVVILQSGVALAPGHDFKVYYDAALRYREGRPLYDAFQTGPPDQPMAYVYISPPPFAMLMAPLTHLPQATAIDVWTLVNHLLLIPVALLLGRLPGGPASLVKTCWAALALLYSFVTFATIAYGQTNLLILLALTGGLLAFEQGHSLLCSVAHGLGMLVKPIPVVPLLALVRGGGIRLLIPVALLGAIAVAPFPRQSADFVTRVIPWVATRDRLALHNQAPQSFWRRLFQADPIDGDRADYRPAIELPAVGHTLATVFAVTIIALTIAALARRPVSDDEVRLGYGLVLLALLAAGRMTEFHHMIWALLPVMIVANHVWDHWTGSARARLLLALGMCWLLLSFPPFTPGLREALRPLLQSPVGAVFASYSALALIALYGINWELLRRSSRCP